MRTCLRRRCHEDAKHVGSTRERARSGVRDDHDVSARGCRLDRVGDQAADDVGRRALACKLGGAGKPIALDCRTPTHLLQPSAQHRLPPLLVCNIAGRGTSLRRCSDDDLLVDVLKPEPFGDEMSDLVAAGPIGSKINDAAGHAATLCRTLIVVKIVLGARLGARRSSRYNRRPGAVSSVGRAPARQAGGSLVRAQYRPPRKASANAGVFVVSGGNACERRMARRDGSHSGVRTGRLDARRRRQAEGVTYVAPEALSKMITATKAAPRPRAAPTTPNQSPRSTPPSTETTSATPTAHSGAGA